MNRTFDTKAILTRIGLGLLARARMRRRMEEIDAAEILEMRANAFFGEARGVLIDHDDQENGHA